MIQLNSVSKVFTKTKAGIKDISISIPDGQWVTLLGPSGSGKSTLLKLIAGLEKQTSGTLSQPYSKKETGFVFQDAALLPWKTVTENITLPLTLRGESKSAAEQKADPWIEKFKLNRFKESYPHELSGGLKMRVSLARALITVPKLLLLDEPFSALDEPIRIELGLELRELFNSLKPTIILVTHSITEGLWLADRVVLLRGQPGMIALDQETGLGQDRPLEIRATKTFNEKVEEFFQYLRSER